MTPVWCDLSAYRPDEARLFYQRVLGWTVSDDTYALARTGGVPVAAIFEMPQRFRDMRMPSFWMSYFAVSSVSQTVMQARDLGARIELEEESNDGRIALVRDPLGAGFTIYEGPMPPGAYGCRPGQRCGHILIVSDAGVAGFYETLFGWSTQERNGGWRFLQGTTPVAELHEAPESERAGYEYWAIAFAARNLGQAEGAVQAAGGRVFGRTMLLDGPALLVADKDGAAFFIVET